MQNMDTISSILTLLGMLGVPSLFSATCFLFKRIKKNDEETNAIKYGIQALLRAQMIAEYNTWSEKGYAPIWARDNFDNCWTQYHNLGANGVMNDIHDKFMELPVSKQ